jgi:hypothetical protein
MSAHKKPTCERRVSGEPVSLICRIDEYLLHDILGRLSIPAQTPERGAINKIGMQTHKFGESFL